MKGRFNITLLVALALFSITGSLLVGCGGSEEDDAIEKAKQQDKQKQIEQIGHDVVVVQKLFYMMPSPVEIASMLKKAGASYNPELLNSLQNLNTYESTKSKALNLGIYGSDLSYASIFNNTQDAMFYVKACKSLADGLGVSNAFDQETMERVEDNIDNPDSMLYVISDSYWLADAYLKEHERSVLSALIIAGGWIEGLYLATQLVDPSNPNQLGQQVADQKFSLEHLMNLITTYSDHADLASIHTELKELHGIYSELEVQKLEKKENKVDANGITTISGSKKLVVTPEQLKRIITKVEAIRTGFIQ